MMFQGDCFTPQKVPAHRCSTFQKYRTLGAGFAGLTVTDWSNRHCGCFNSCTTSFIKQESTEDIYLCLLMLEVKLGIVLKREKKKRDFF